MAKRRKKRIKKDHTVPPVFAFDEWLIITEWLALSPRQAQVLGLVIQSHKDQDIVDALNIGKSTVRTHLIETKKRLLLRAVQNGGGGRPKMVALVR